MSTTNLNVQNANTLIPSGLVNVDNIYTRSIGINNTAPAARLHITPGVTSSFLAESTSSFGVTTANSFGINRFSGDGNAYFDQTLGSTSGFVFRNNNGGSNLLSVLNTQISTPNQFVSTRATNQLVLGSGNTATINAASLAGNRIYTIPDTSADSSFVMTASDQTISGVKTFSSGILLPTSGGTPSSLDYYEQGTHASTFTGGTFTSGTITLNFTRVGNVVTMRWPAIQGAATANIVNNTALPTRLRPGTVQAFTIQGQANSSITPIQVSVGTTGILTFSPSTGGAFSLGTNGPTLSCITYLLS